MVHYIRFLRPPQCAILKKSVDVSSVVAVQTDLGDALLNDQITLVAEITNVKEPYDVLYTQDLQWEATSRALKFTLQCPAKYIAQRVRLHVTTLQTQATLKAKRIPEVIDIWSSELLLADQERAEPLVERQLVMHNKTISRSWEEMGESIARHIW
jgi:hypothetical protein